MWQCVVMTILVQQELDIALDKIKLKLHGGTICFMADVRYVPNF